MLLLLSRYLSRGANLRYKWASVALCPCGGKFGRVHRTLKQRLTYMAVYRCRLCGRVSVRPRRFMFYFADRTRCPLCGTERLGRLAERDPIDRLHWNLFRLCPPLFRTRLYHCRYCRIQFYDVVRTDNETSSAA